LDYNCAHRFFLLENLDMTRPLPLRQLIAELTLTTFVLGLVLHAGVARADSPGQDDLDKATQQKLGAQTVDDLTDVIKLCESAIKKGLDKGNTAFANDLMASAYVQRGSVKATQAYRAVLAIAAKPDAAAVADDQWKTYRSEALADLERGTQLSPKQPQAFFETAKLNLLPGGDRQKARAALDKTIELAGDDATLRADALLRRSTLRSEAKQRLADLDEAIRALPGNFVLLAARAQAQADSGHSDAAIADFDKAIAADPKQVLTYQRKLDLLVKLKKWPEALATLEKGHVAVPDNIEFLVARAQIFVSQSSFKAAAEELTRALAINGSNLPILELRAALYQQLGEKAKALADIEKILQVKPDLPNAIKLRALRAVLLAEVGKGDAAIEEMQRLHKANPKDSVVMLQMGMLYSNLKKYDKAIEVYTAILASHPDDVEAMRGRGDAYLNGGHRVEAEADYERALKLQPHDLGILNNFAWVLATAPEDKLRDGHRAVAMANDACRQTDYKQDYILSTLAAAYAEIGDFESARKWATKAVDVEPSPNAEPSRKDELKKELESYRANKPWREALPLPEVKKGDEKKVEAKKAEEKKPASDGKKNEAAVKKEPAKVDATTK
jgi:tetratricopeptide (TPR) repeat protein